MPSNEPLQLTGELRAGRFFLELHTREGAVWELDANHTAHHLIGKKVNIIGRQAGFSDLLCDQIWPAGEPRPTGGTVSGRAWLEVLLISIGLAGALLLHWL